MTAHTLVCIGGGHANLQLIAADRPLAPAARRVLISDGAVAVYSGMLPAVVAGLIEAEEANVDLQILCERHGWEFINARVTAISAAKQKIKAVSRGPNGTASFDVAYSVLSVDVGSSSTPLQLLPPHGEESQRVPSPATIVSTRPIGMLLPRIRMYEAVRSRIRAAIRVCVVGAGKAGVELALAVDARFRRTMPDAECVSVTLVGRKSDLEPTLGAAARAVSSELHVRGIKLLLGYAVVGVRGNSVELDSGLGIESDLVIVATGAASPMWLRHSTDLEVDENGYISVEPTLRVVGLTNVFAAGDCASIVGRSLPKAGVYAVRQGPILEKNIAAVVRRVPGDARSAVLQPYEPQALALALLSLGDESRRAIGTKGRLVVTGHWVFNLKMYLDRRWQSRFNTKWSRSNSSNVEKDRQTTVSREEGDIFDGNAAEGASLLFGPEGSSSEEFARQYSVLRRMDADPEFAAKVHDACV